MDVGFICSSEMRHMGTSTYDFLCKGIVECWHLSVDWKPVC